MRSWVWKVLTHLYFNRLIPCTFMYTHTSCYYTVVECWISIVKHFSMRRQSRSSRKRELRWYYGDNQSSRSSSSSESFYMSSESCHIGEQMFYCLSWVCKINLCSFLILSSVLQHRVKVCLAFVVCVFMMAGYYIDGPHQQVRWKGGKGGGGGDKGEWNWMLLWLCKHDCRLWFTLKRSWSGMGIGLGLGFSPQSDWELGYIPSFSTW